MMVRTLIGVVVALLALPGLLQADQHTDDEMQPLTWVRFYNVKPGHGEDFMNMIMEVNAPAFDGMMADGSILGWGAFVPFTVSADEHWTHGLWVTAQDWAHLDTFMKGLIASEAKMNPVEVEHYQRKYLDIVHAEDTNDEISRQVAGAFADMTKVKKGTPTYMWLGFYKVKPGHMEDAIGVYREYGLPVMEKLCEEGSVLGAGLSRPEIVNTSDWSLMSWTMTSDLGSMDRIDAAYEAMNEKRSEAEQESMMNDFMEHFDWEGFRSKIIRIVHMGGQDKGKEKQATNEKTDEAAVEHHAAKD
jgi:hypothetical protein